MGIDRIFTRRKLIASTGAVVLAGRCARAAEPLQIAPMSKFYQFLDLEGMASAVARMGFDGIDLCVRPGAHVLPERVEDDLPRAAEIFRRHSLKLTMITTAIVDTTSPAAEKILRTAVKLGVRHYRWGGFRYDLSRDIAKQLDSIKPRVAELAAMNKEIGVCAMYHTHSGVREVGASIWDLWYLLKDHDPRWVSANLDIGHATVEGGYGGWIHSARLILPYTRGIAIKDFRWGRNAKGEWIPEWCPLGEGMVNFRRYLPMVKESGFNGPVQLHYEYPLGGADQGSKAPTIAHEQIWTAMRRDLNLLRAWLREAGLSSL